jgi:hypothetical protein
MSNSVPSNVPPQGHPALQAAAFQTGVAFRLGQAARARRDNEDFFMAALPTRVSDVPMHRIIGTNEWATDRAERRAARAASGQTPIPTRGEVDTTRRGLRLSVTPSDWVGITDPETRRRFDQLAWGRYDEMADRTDREFALFRLMQSYNPYMGGFNPSMMGGFNPYMGGFNPSMMGGFNPSMMGGFNPSMMGGFNPSMMGGFNPSMMGGFNPYMGGFNPSMMGGFNPSMMGGFNPSMMGGFHPSQLMGGFNPSQLMGLNPFGAFGINPSGNMPQFGMNPLGQF